MGAIRPSKWGMGVLNDKETFEVPGSVLLLASDHNEPLGLRSAPARTSHSSIPVGLRLHELEEQRILEEKKKTDDGRIILEPQPDDSANDPLNWPAWRRDAALLSLGLFCMVGGGMTPLLAAGFTNVAEDYNVPVSRVSLTTGLYMMGMGLGSVVFSPTAILYGKRPVYLFGAGLLIFTSIWCALSPNFTSLVLARIFQGIAVSPVECLPSATIAEIFFLHERAYRIGIYTLLLLGGKNLVPLVSAVTIQSLGWRWVFWMVAMVVVVCGALLFFFVPETFWDRAPVPKSKGRRPSLWRRYSSQQQLPEAALRRSGSGHQREKAPVPPPVQGPASQQDATSHARPGPTVHIGFASDVTLQKPVDRAEKGLSHDGRASSAASAHAPESVTPGYTNALRDMPAKSFVQQLRPFHGRLNKDKWHKVMVRPFILFSYPAVLWSSAVYSCSIGWLIVISEAVAVIYRNSDSYNFTALQTGLVYLSPFVGGILGTAVAGKLSDVIVNAITRANGGLYEPEFRLVMVIPVAVTTAAGLMGFGWSAQERDAWIVPTVFFGIVSFGCALGSTTSITFCVDSYRQYAGEALVTLNFSKNIFHGLVFSLFVTGWITADGPKAVFIWIGVMQLIVLAFTAPMYVYGKRARMWTVRRNFMEKF